MSAQIFVSYRRADSAGWAGRLHDDLERLFGPGRVFRDVGIAPGVDFRQHIEDVLDRCDTIIAVIGPRWASAASADGRRRLDDPRDLVRREIARALQRPDVHVIPVLVDGAAMPTAEELPHDLQALRARNAIELTDSRWDYDVHRLYRDLLERFGETPRDREPTPRLPAAAGTMAAAGAVAALLAGVLTEPLSSARAEVAIDRDAALVDRLSPAAERLSYYAVERGLVWAAVLASALVAGSVVLRRSDPRSAVVAPLILGLAAGAIAGAVGAAVYIALKDLPAGTPWEWLIQAVQVGVIGGLAGGAFGRLDRAVPRAELRLAGLAGGLVAGALAATVLGGLPRPVGLSLQAAIVVGAIGAVVAMPAHRPAAAAEWAPTALSRKLIR
jgi:hypothetical protein